MNPLHPKENPLMAEFSRIQLRFSRFRRRLESRDEFAKRHPEIVEARINMAKAKRTNRLARNIVAAKFQKPWVPHPAHNKPTYKKLRAAEGLSA